MNEPATRSCTIAVLTDVIFLYTRLKQKRLCYLLITLKSPLLSRHLYPLFIVLTLTSGILLKIGEAMWGGVLPPHLTRMFTYIGIVASFSKRTSAQKRIGNILDLK